MTGPNHEKTDRRHSLLCFCVVIALLVVGIFLRLPPEPFEHGPLHALQSAHLQSHLKGVGVDEKIYRDYVNELGQLGLASYPRVVHNYVERQKAAPGAILPPLRALYIVWAFAWQHCFGGDAISALRNVAAAFSILSLLLATVFAARLDRSGYFLAITALMAFAPTQLHVSQHAIIDGVFAFWALLTIWSLWESLNHPANLGWKLLYGLALVALVLTKENALFVWLGVIVILIANRWLRIGTVTRGLLVLTFLAPAISLIVLMLLAGGVPILIDTYRLFITKNYGLKYSELTQDGPWHRYLVDLLLVSPIVLILALGTVFRLNRTMKPELFISIFIAASYLVMCNVKYGMNLRYANMWDLPLRFLAFSQIVAMASWVKSYRAAITAAAVIFLAAIEFHQYIVLAVHYPLYELITHDLLQALRILKSP